MTRDGPRTPDVVLDRSSLHLLDLPPPRHRRGRRLSFSFSSSFERLRSALHDEDVVANHRALHVLRRAVFRLERGAYGGESQP